MKINQLKLKIHDTFGKDEKITTNFKPVNNDDVINKTYLDEKLSKIEGHLSLFEKESNEFLLNFNKQFVEEI